MKNTALSLLICGLASEVNAATIDTNPYWTGVTTQ